MNNIAIAKTKTLIFDEKPSACSATNVANEILIQKINKLG